VSAPFGQPDPSPPGRRRRAYALQCWINRHPLLLRGVGALLRRFPSLGNRFGVAARRSAVRQVLRRTQSFTNKSHATKLVAGDFLIGMDAGPAYDADKKRFAALLGQLDAAGGANRAAKDCIADLRLDKAWPTFDLIEDYLMWVVLQALKPGFGAAADRVVSGSAVSAAPDRALGRRHMLEVRHVAAHLFGGDGAPADVQRRAELCAAALNARIDDAVPELRLAAAKAGLASGTSRADLSRNARGLAWVSHPVTVQAGALLVHELLNRPAVYRQLRELAQPLGDKAWSDTDFRKDVRAHVLELMRFRPVFPALARNVPREACFESGAAADAVCKAGSTVIVFTLAALFDSRATPDAARFCPHRWLAEDDARMLMFGLGDRQCPAKEQALDILVSALIGLLTLPELSWAERGSRRIRYDGPMVSGMRLRARAALPA